MAMVYTSDLQHLEPIQMTEKKKIDGKTDSPSTLGEGVAARIEETHTSQ